MRISDWSSDVCSSDPDEPTRARLALPASCDKDAINRNSQAAHDASASLRAGRNAVHQLMQFAGFPHLHHDVGAADELALHIELRDRRPVGIVLDALTDFHVLQHVRPEKGGVGKK